MEIVILSRVLKTLDRDECRTSSQLFELGVASALGHLARVLVLSTAADFDEESATVRLRVLPGRGPLALRLNSAIRDRGFEGDGTRCILMFGYDPAIIASLRSAARNTNAKLASFVFDTHAVAIEHHSQPRRLLIDGYFRMGQWSLRYLDGLIVLNEKTPHRLSVKGVPHLVSRVGVDSEDNFPGRYRRKSEGPFQVLYAGSLESCNSITPLLNSMAHIQDPSVELGFAGRGKLLPLVERAAAVDPRIKYYGLLDRSTLDPYMRSADLLVNLRDLDHAVADCSFPSKLIDYMASGVPILTSPVIQGPEFASCANLVPVLDARSIAEAILRVKNSPELQAAKTLSAHMFVDRHHLWPSIAKELVNFLERIYRGD